MPKSPAKFKLSDLTRAVKAAAQSPVPMAVEIRPDGTIVLAPTAGQQPVKTPVALDPGHAL